jgi:hypothetical protein
MFPHEYTPLNLIPGNTTFFLTNFEFGRCFHGCWRLLLQWKDEEHQKRSNKMKRGESAKSRSSTKRVFEWKFGPDLEENSI